jgi:hypothetical protein
MGFTKLKDAGGSGNGGATEVEIVSPTSVFGPVLIADLTPQGQGDFIYGIQDQIFITSSFLGSTISTSGGLCSVSSGTDPNGSATVFLRRGLKYRAGQGSMMRVTTLFDTPSAGNAQIAGAGTAESGYFFGYFGTNFGILHSTTGQREIRRFDFTTGAGTGDVTVTLNGESVVVPVTGGSDLTQTAYQLSLGNYTQIGGTAGGFLSDPVSSSIYYIAARSNTTSTGSYSIAGASIGGSFTIVKSGEAQTNTFIPSGSFNIDRLDGTGPSGMILDPLKGNIFQIAFQYLGFGNAVYSIENPESGKLVNFHIVKNANSRTTTVLKNPNLSALVTSANIAGGTTSKTLKCGSMATFIEGTVINLDPKYSLSFQFNDLKKTTYYPLALLKANRVHNDESCWGEFDLLRFAASNQTTSRTLTIGLFVDAEVGGPVDFQYVNENNSIVSYATLDVDGANPDNTIVNLAGLVPFYEILIGPNTSTQELIAGLKILFTVGRAVLIAVKADGSGGLAGTVATTWFEQQ